MKCPDEIHEKLLSILEMGIMNIQLFIGKKQYDHSSCEAYHIHNLPSLIRDFSYARLAYYLDVEAVQYLREMGNLVREDYKKVLNSLSAYRKNQNESLM